MLRSGQPGKSRRRLRLGRLFVNFASAHAGQPAEIQRTHVAAQQFVTQWRQPAHPASPILFGKAIVVVTLVQPQSKQPMRLRLLNRKNGLGFEGPEGLGIERTFRHSQAQKASTPVSHIDVSIKVASHPIGGIALEIAPLVIIDEAGRRNAGTRRARAVPPSASGSVARQLRAVTVFDGAFFTIGDGPAAQVIVTVLPPRPVCRI
ncbi:MAG: hypothetical protein M0Z76_04425, partial [Gammaproteobacteria bacterium]|nr:hypothetical protein [Gammaproteobacteria bacterium]